jgi:hypothetical protein
VQEARNTASKAISKEDKVAKVAQVNDLQDLALDNISSVRRTA